MELSELRQDLLDEVEALTAWSFDHTVVETNFVPSIDDSDITYPNLIERQQKSKLLESAVLFVDLRNSTEISLKHDQETLATIYSCYARAMTRCGQYYGGKIRNIIGDRVMVVFDRRDCFRHAINTAILMNSVVKYLLNAEITDAPIKCGIGIDFGPMLISKTGIIKRGRENTSNKSLVWLGRPANVASKLTDMAHKPANPPQLMVNEGYCYDVAGQWWWNEVSPNTFLDNLTCTLRQIRHKDPLFITFHTTTSISSTNPPILFTEDFYDGLIDEAPNLQSVREGWWWQTSLEVPGYKGKIYGGDVCYTVFKE